VLVMVLRRAAFPQKAIHLIGWSASVETNSSWAFILRTSSEVVLLVAGHHHLQLRLALLVDDLPHRGVDMLVLRSAASRTGGMLLLFMLLLWRRLVIVPVCLGSSRGRFGATRFLLWLNKCGGFRRTTTFPC